MLGSQNSWQEEEKILGRKKKELKAERSRILGNRMAEYWATG
jgi:hypothetical protein